MISESVQNEIMAYLINNTSKQVFEIALRNHNIHSLYRSRKNFLLYEYFDGNVLRFSVSMCEMFNQFITEGKQIEAAQLNWEISQLSQAIRRAKKYKSPHSELVKEHNEKIAKYNELMCGVNTLIALWNKAHKSTKKTA